MKRESESDKNLSNKDLSKHLVIAGVSGGPDSMLLANRLLDQGYNLVIAHVNYHKRQSALRDEKIAEAFAVKHGLPFEKLDVYELEGNFQDAARKVRYDFFVELAKKYGVKRIAVAHHLDDLLETYLMQKERGAIPQYYGLPQSRSYQGFELIRPLLDLDKEAILQACKELGIEYGIDESNLKDDYRRNQIRHSIIEKMDAEKKQELLKQIDADNEKLQREREELDQRFKQPGLLDGKNPEQALGELLFRLEHKRHSQSELQDLLRQIKTASIETEDGWLEKSGGHLLYINKEKPFEPVTIKRPEDFPEKMGIFELEMAKQGKPVEKLYVKEQDFPLVLRPAKEGDSIAMRFGKKSLHRFFIDRHIPRILRRHWPVIENADGQVVYVFGLGADKNHYDAQKGFFLSSPLDNFQEILNRYDIMNFDLL